MLGVVQEWLASDRPAGERLAVVTRGAASVAAGEGVPDLAGAAVRGLVTDRARAERLGAAGHEHCADRFLLDRQLGEYAEFFSRLCEPSAIRT